MSNAPSITTADIEANIKHVFYFSAYEGVHRALVNDPFFNMCFEEASAIIPESLKLLTICVVVTKSGFTVIGESACVSKENYIKELGQEIAKKNAINKLWNVMGYNLSQTLYLQASDRSSARSEAKGEDGEHDAVGTGEAEVALIHDLESAADNVEFTQDHQTTTKSVEEA